MMWSQMLTTPQHKKAVLERRRDKETGRERENYGLLLVCSMGKVGSSCKHIVCTQGKDKDVI